MNMRALGRTRSGFSNAPTFMYRVPRFIVIALKTIFL